MVLFHEDKDCEKISLTGSHVQTHGSPLVAPCVNVVELLGGAGLLEEGGQWE